MCKQCGFYDCAGECSVGRSKENQQANIIKVTFNDGESFESKGCSSGIRDNNLSEDLKWISYTLPGYIRDKGKDFKDVKCIVITIDYIHTGAQAGN